jgi:hypothetical protein
MVQSNTRKKEALLCDKIRIRMRNTMSEITVKDCTLKRIFAGKKVKIISKLQT